jgi:D-glycero-D-manno-heptose 1,7-bisphosphate phosphatase
MAAQDLVSAPGAAAPATAAAGPRRAAFLDRDGVINVDHGYTYRIEDFDLVDGALAAAAALARLGLALVVVTNQAGIGRGMYTEEDFARLSGWMRERFAQAGAPLDGIYHCPHHPSLALGALRTVCACRKPAPGMLLTAARELRLDLAGSVIFGDKCDDMRAGAAAGVGLRVLLGKDGLAVPTQACPQEASAAGVPIGTAAQPALVTHRYASLASALGDPDLVATLAGGGVAAAAAQRL